jgi:hypothetical protein
MMATVVALVEAWHFAVGSQECVEDVVVHYDVVLLLCCADVHVLYAIFRYGFQEIICQIREILVGDEHQEEG